MPSGFGDVYRRWAEAGWGGVSAPAEFGGMGLPHLVNVACTEIWNGASMAFALCPLLTEGAIGALKAHGSPDLLDTYLAAMISGRWTGTMNLTEPQAGSDLNAVKTRAERAEDGTYRLFGQKIFITYGEHDMAENIVHLVLARLPGAPAGTRGLSLFVAPKFLVDPDGTLGPAQRSALRQHRAQARHSRLAHLRHDLWRERRRQGLAGRRGERGLAAMFVMMNAARLGVGTQGVAIGERAYQQALAFARERRQGRGPNGGDGMVPIIEHADVQRMLMTMKAYMQAARGICHLTAAALDLASHGRTEAERAAGANRAALLTPIAKSFSTDIGDEAASLGVQIHGGWASSKRPGRRSICGFRIAAIYEGANGIHAIDLVHRKLPLAGGETVRNEIAFIRDIVRRVEERDEVGSARRLSAWRRRRKRSIRRRGTCNDGLRATSNRRSPAHRLFAPVRIDARRRLSGESAGLAAEALVADGNRSEIGRVGLARFFAEKLLPVVPGLARAIASGAEPLQSYEAVLADSA